MNRRLKTIYHRIDKIQEQKARLEEELGLLLLEKEELEDQEIVAVCKKHNISLEDLMKKIKEEKKEKQKENDNHEKDANE